MPFDHSFLSGGSDFSVFFNTFFFHFSSSYQSMLLGNGFCMSILLFFILIALSFHAARKNVIRPFISFLKGLVSLYFSIVSSIIVHCSINPCFWEGVDAACQFFLLSYWGGGCRIILHCSVIIVFPRKQLLYPHLLFWEGIDSSIKMCVHI